MSAPDHSDHAHSARDQPFAARVLSLYPAMFPGPLGHSLAGGALEAGRWSLAVHDIRDFATDRHHTVDGAPFGGGPGMVLRADVLDAALAATVPAERRDEPVVVLSPRGRPLDQARVNQLAGGGGVTLICGRFEGIDERFIDAHGADEISLGDFVLSGGEPAALALLDAVVRLLPNVVGAAESLVTESFAAGLLEYPQYTRPRLWDGQAVPEVLLSGDHAAIAAWRRREAERITRERRPDLWARRARGLGARGARGLTSARAEP